MAFLRKAGSILRQTAGRQINSEICGASPSVFQIIRSMSSSKVFIGGLSYSTDDQGLLEACNKYGSVIEARIIMDRESGRSRGFGFVTFTSPEEASAAIQALDQQELHGRRVRVNYATEKPRGGGFGYGGGGGGYGGGDGGYGGGGGSYGGGGGGYGGGGGGYGGGGGSYGGGGNYNQGGESVGNYNQGGESVGNYNQGSNFNSGSAGDFGFAGGVAGGDTGANTSFENSGGFDGDNGAGESGQIDSIQDNLRDDDDEPSNFAKRA